MLNLHSIGSTQWSDVPSVGALRNAFTSDWDLLQWNWPTPTETATEGEEGGQAKFLTRVEVTGDLSSTAAYTAVCRLVCLYTLSRLSESGLHAAERSRRQSVAARLAVQVRIRSPGTRPALIL